MKKTAEREAEENEMSNSRKRSRREEEKNKPSEADPVSERTKSINNIKLAFQVWVRVGSDRKEWRKKDQQEGNHSE